MSTAGGGSGGGSGFGQMSDQCSSGSRLGAVCSNMILTTGSRLLSASARMAWACALPGAVSTFSMRALASARRRSR